MFFRRKDWVFIFLILLSQSVASIYSLYLVGSSSIVLLGMSILGAIFIAYFQLKSHLWEAYRQIESLLSVIAIIKPRLPLPAMRGEAISPDFAKEMVSLIQTHKPRVILEAGSGTSTIVAAYCLEAIGQGKLYALEHKKEYAERTADHLVCHQLEKHAEVLFSPLREIRIADTTWLWYDLERIEQIGSIDMLIVDGPPETTQPLARYPLLPLLSKHLTPNTILLVDDAHRKGERAAVKRWLEEFPFFYQESIDSEKGMVLLRRRPHRKD